MRQLKFHGRATNHPGNDANEVSGIKVHFRLRHRRAAPLFRLEGTNRKLRTFLHTSAVSPVPGFIVSHLLQMYSFK